MKKYKIIIILGMIILFASVGLYQSQVAHADSPQSESIYRLYNTNNKEHLYTSDAHEKDTLPHLSKDWRYEGVAWASPLNAGSPVYRVYNPRSGEHLNTTDANEVKVLTTKNGWVSEKTAFSSAPNGQPVYRLFNPAAGVGAHFVTMDAHEKSVLMTRGWKYEGVAWYALAKDGTTPSLNLPLSGPKTAFMSGDMYLSGAGTGYQAKFTLNGAGEHAVSFGIQLDSGSSFFAGNAKNKATFMSENINGSSHVYTAYDSYASLNTWVHMELAYYEASNTIGFYINNKLVGTAYAPNFKNNYVVTVDGKHLIANVGGSARMRGDRVNAEFKNVQTSKKGMTAWNDTSNDWAGLNATWTNKDINSSNFTVVGTSTLPVGINWDTYWQVGLPTADGVAQTSLFVN